MERSRCRDEEAAYEAWRQAQKCPDDYYRWNEPDDHDLRVKAEQIAKTKAEASRRVTCAPLSERFWPTWDGWR